MSRLTNDDLDRLLKLRVIVARFGEMDMAKRWNTNGQLGPLGSSTVRRGLPRTHHFAQAPACWFTKRSSRPSPHTHPVGVAGAVAIAAGGAP